MQAESFFGTVVLGKIVVVLYTDVVNCKVVVDETFMLIVLFNFFELVVGNIEVVDIGDFIFEVTTLILLTISYCLQALVLCFGCLQSGRKLGLLSSLRGIE